VNQDVLVHQGAPLQHQSEFAREPVPDVVALAGLVAIPEPTAA
jgi:hypothetical protein